MTESSWREYKPGGTSQGEYGWQHLMAEESASSVILRFGKQLNSSLLTRREDRNSLISVAGVEEGCEEDMIAESRKVVTCRSLKKGLC